MELETIRRNQMTSSLLCTRVGTARWQGDINNRVANLRNCAWLVEVAITGWRRRNATRLEGDPGFLPDTMEDTMVSKDFCRQLGGYALTTAHIVYRRPDHPWLLQSYVWQEYDLFPNFPSLKRFLDFWEKKLDGALHSVTVGHSRLIQPAEIRSVDGVFRLH